MGNRWRRCVQTQCIGWRVSSAVSGELRLYLAWSQTGDVVTLRITLQTKFPLRQSYERGTSWSWVSMTCLDQEPLIWWIKNECWVVTLSTWVSLHSRNGTGCCLHFRDRYRKRQHRLNYIPTNASPPTSHVLRKHSTRKMTENRTTGVLTVLHFASDFQWWYAPPVQEW